MEAQIAQKNMTLRSSADAYSKNVVFSLMAVSSIP